MGRPSNEDRMARAAEMTEADRLSVRIVALAPLQRRTLDAVSSAGRPVRLKDLVPAVSRWKSQVLTALVALWGHGLVVRRGDHYRARYVPSPGVAELLGVVPSLATVRSNVDAEVGIKIMAAVKELAAGGEWPSVEQVRLMAGIGRHATWKWMGRLRDSGLFPETVGLSRWDGASQTLAMIRHRRSKRSSRVSEPRCRKEFAPKVYTARVSHGV